MRLGLSWPLYTIALPLLLGLGSNLGSAQEQTAEPTGIAIPENAKSTNRWIRQMFETSHVGRRGLDDNTSSLAMRLFLDELDPEKTVFLASDVEAFQAYEHLLDDQFRDDNFEFATRVYRVFVNRLPQSFAIAHQQIYAIHDFDTREDYDTQAQSTPYANNLTELTDRYRKIVKYRFLKGRSAGETDLEIRNELHARFHTRERRESALQVNAMLVRYFTSLGHALDPHTRYMSSEETDAMFGRRSQQQIGIGAALKSENGIIQVQSLISGGAASVDGRLRSGDSILSVRQPNSENAIDLQGMSVDDVAKLIRGEIGTRIVLQIRHAGTNTTETIEITRAPIRSPENETQSRVITFGERLDGSPSQIGWLQIPSFYADSDDPKRSVTHHIRQSLASFRKANVDVVVLDLSKNDSGSLSEVIATVGLFIDQGVVLQSQYSGGEIQLRQDEIAGVEWAGPLVVKVSQISTSASEVFAGAIQDYQRGLIVGDPKTHGKGTIQTVLPDVTQSPLDSGGLLPGSLKLTIQRFYLPSGRSTQLVGVSSDVTLPSITSKLHVSESDLNHALQPDHVPSVAFDPCGSINKSQIETLQRNSAQRIAANPAFQQSIQQANQFELQSSMVKIPLQESEFFKSQVFDMDQLKSEARQLSDLNREMDFYDQEILSIAHDFVTLQRVTNP
jgi:carboxyl-terminal processing protease